MDHSKRLAPPKISRRKFWRVKILVIHYSVVKEQGCKNAKFKMKSVKFRCPEGTLLFLTFNFSLYIFCNQTATAQRSASTVP